MRFLLDEDLPHKVAGLARDVGLDVVSSLEAGRNGWTDERQLRQAGRDCRCLVTRNYSHFNHLTPYFIAHKWEHAGLLFVPRSLRGDDFGGLVRALRVYGQLHPGDHSPYTVDFLRPAR